MPAITEKWRSRSATSNVGVPYVRNSTVALLALVATELFLTHAPIGSLVRDVQQHFRLADKAIHLAMYASFTLAVATIWSLRRRATLSPQRVMVVMVSIAIYGAVDEATQPYFGRHAELFDYAANVIGILFGAAAYCLMSRNIDLPRLLLRKHASLPGRS